MRQRKKGSRKNKNNKVNNHGHLGPKSSFVFSVNCFLNISAKLWQNLKLICKTKQSVLIWHLSAVGTNYKNNNKVSRKSKKKEIVYVVFFQFFYFIKNDFGSEFWQCKNITSLKVDQHFFLFIFTVTNSANSKAPMLNVYSD